MTGDGVSLVENDRVQSSTHGWSSIVEASPHSGRKKSACRDGKACNREENCYSKGWNCSSGWRTIEQ